MGGFVLPAAQPQMGSSPPNSLARDGLRPKENRYDSVELVLTFPVTTATASKFLALAESRQKLPVWVKGGDGYSKQMSLRNRNKYTCLL